jgi:hypothetical protein
MRLFLAASGAFLSLVQPISGQQQGSPDPSHFTVLGITVGRDDIKTLDAKLGSVKKCHTHRHMQIAGYRNATEEVTFEFSEVGGGDVTGFCLGATHAKQECPLSQLPLSFSIVSTAGGVHLGMSEEDFVRIFGPPPARAKDGKWEYSWSWEQQLSDEQKKEASRVYPGASVSRGEVSVRVKAYFSNHTLREFCISKLEVL